MRHSCCSRLFFVFLLLTGTLFAFPQKSAIIYYADDISYANVGAHDYIILEPDNVSPYTHGFKTYKKKIYAYVSLGETVSSRTYASEIRPEWKLKQNRLWNSTVMDVSNDAYHEFIYDKVIQPLVDKGYENIFFDTLDAYQSVAATAQENEKYRLGLIRFIKKLKHRFPTMKLILNRGFEIMDEVHQELEAVLFESLFYGLSSKDLSYTAVKQEDRAWLLAKVDTLKSYGLDVIALDYIDINEKEKIADTVEKIKALGIIPYVSNKALTRYGNSSKKVVKREILVLFNSDIEKELSSAHFLASLPLEYLGYIPVLKRIEEGLPDEEMLSRYRAVVIWPEKLLQKTRSYTQWIELLLKHQIKVLFLEGFALTDDTELCTRLGVDKITNKTEVLDKQTILHKDKAFDFETPLRLRYAPALYHSKQAEPLLSLSNKEAQVHMPVALMPWGGYALSGMVTASFMDDTLWVIDPFVLFKKGLALEDIPAPDPTTENGRRLLFAHIDGDASMNKVEWDPRSFSIGMMYEKILNKYTIPQSVSIVQAETDPQGLYPKDSAALEEEAKKIFRLEYVEGATHTLTHPFFWGKIKDDDLDEKYRLKLQGYDFSIDKEISGSLSYINTRLMPPGKEKANTIFWTGDCMPQEEVLEYTYKHDILNINGGYTVITNDKPWLSLVASYGLKRGEYRQVYTGAENENVFTNDWLGPFWGFRKVIQTFELTERPRRLKPIDIYYHFYAASKTASLTALDDVYKWALKQETMPIYTSEYIPKVMEFYDLSMYKEADKWYCEGMQALKTLRLSQAMPEVDYQASQAVLGEKKEGENRYVHLDTQATTIALGLKGSVNKDENYLIDTNAEVLGYEKSAKKTAFKLHSYVDIVLNYHLKKGCTLETRPQPLRKSNRADTVSVELKGKEADVIIQCR